jgi:hypothetical protein
MSVHGSTGSPRTCLCLYLYLVAGLIIKSIWFAERGDPKVGCEARIQFSAVGHPRCVAVLAEVLNKWLTT